MANISNLIGLLVLLVVVAIAAFVAYHTYLWSNEIKDRASQHLEKKNIGFTKEGGLRVGVKQRNDESYVDKTQNVLVNVWNNAELPNYKSRLGWNSTQANAKKAAAKSAASPVGETQTRTGRTEVRPSASAPASGTNLAPPEQRPRRSASPVPGGWE